MRAIAKISWVVVFGIALAAWADESGEPREPDAEPAAEAEAPEAERPTQEPSRQVVYVPPSRGAARARVGGGTRGSENAPTIAVLAPDHVGVTNRAQPTLAWFASAATVARVDLTVTDPDAVEPLLETTIASPVEPGVQLVRLSNHAIELEEGRSYDWSVSLVLDPDARDLDVVAVGAIRRNRPSPELATQLQSETASYLVLARAGVWYDALADLSDAIAADPENAALREERASLLEQVGVGAAAAYERGNGGRGGSGED